MPEISVIVPVYNTEKYIRRCIDSILSQSFTDFELILINDGSTDTSGVICDEYAMQDGRVKVFHQENRGQAIARNYALNWIFANSDSEFISFVDSDDWVHPQFLELLREGIKRFNVDICQCGHIETDGTEKTPEISKNYFYVTPEKQYVEFYSAFMWDKLFSKSCWQEIRFPEGQIYEDVAIWYRILFKEKMLAIVDSVLYFYYKNNDSTVRKDWTSAKFAQIDVWEEQLKFARQYNNKGVFRTALKRYCWVYRHQFEEIQASNQITEIEKKTYCSRLIKRIRKIILQYWNELMKMGILQSYCSWAFPRMACMNRQIRKIFGKIKRMIIK